MRVAVKRYEKEHKSEPDLCGPSTLDARPTWLTPAPS
jgi:hypothetical protein